MTLTRKKVFVAVHISDSAILNGYVVIERGTRLSDALNNLNKDFIVVTEESGQAHILNKHHIVKVLELSDEETA